MDPNLNNNAEEQSSEDFWNAAQEMMAAGQQAAQLLNAPVFNMAYRLQMEDTINQWLTTEPKEVNKRESLYYQAQAQVLMANRMQGFIEQAQVIAQKQAERQDPNVKRNEFLDTQGFGLQ